MERWKSNPEKLVKPTHKGKKMYVNRINITGNKATIDRVIRREFAIEEGDLITSRNMGISKENVEYLGFFDKGGVNWKTHKISENNADLNATVFDVYGKAVYSQLLVNDTEHVIDLTHLSKGIYFIQLVDGENSITN